ncbi:MAG: SCO family protein [Flavobacteriaceae bacterium]|nr:SCO family protein [Flavobacteriaceae bacterium]
MKNKSYIGISFIILIFGILVIPKIIDRAKGGDILDDNRLNKVKGKKSDLVSFAKAPEFSFINEEGEKIPSDFYRDKVYLVEFFFTTCPTICPKMNENMKKLDSVFGNRRDFGIASITINPNVDTPEVLKAYKKRYGITNTNWNFLTGDQDVIFDLAKKFEVYVGENADVAGGFEHSGLFALMDKEGVIRSRKDQFENPILYYRGVKEGESEAQVMELIKDIEKLLKE